MSENLSFSPASFPLIDYELHPGFCGMGADTVDTNRAIHAAFTEIDRSLETLLNDNRALTAEQIEEHFRQRVDPALEQIQSASRTHVEADPVLWDWLQHALRNTRAALLQQALTGDTKRKHVRRATSSTGRQVCMDLEQDGVSVTSMPGADLDLILALLDSSREELLEKRKRDPGRNCWVSMPLRGQWWNIVRSGLENCGAVAGACDYAQRPYRLSYCALVLSHPGECWYKDCYDDASLPTPKTTYMHVDEEHDMIKMIIYLREVRSEHGPFCFIRGSHKWKRSFSQVCFFKRMEAQYCANLPREGLEDLIYHRKMWKVLRFRRQFMRLPKPLRGCSHFGDDVLDGTPLSNYLLQSESTITSAEGNVIVFHGGVGIHRGGLVQEGERWALQIGLQKAPHMSLPRKALATSRSAVAQGLRYLLGDNVVGKVKDLLKGAG